MERQIKDVMTLVLQLRHRVAQQTAQATKDELTVIHVALKGLLLNEQSRPSREESA